VAAAVCVVSKYLSMQGSNFEFSAQDKTWITSQLDNCRGEQLFSNRFLVNSEGIYTLGYGRIVATVRLIDISSSNIASYPRNYEWMAVLNVLSSFYRTFVTHSRSQKTCRQFSAFFHPRLVLQNNASGVLRETREQRHARRLSTIENR